MLNQLILINHTLAFLNNHPQEWYDRAWGRLPISLKCHHDYQGLQVSACIILRQCRVKWQWRLSGTFWSCVDEIVTTVLFRLLALVIKLHCCFFTGTIRPGMMPPGMQQFPSWQEAIITIRWCYCYINTAHSHRAQHNIFIVVLFYHQKDSSYFSDWYIVIRGPVILL